jgi:predicted GNAT family N-acyltransferase
MPELLISATSFQADRADIYTKRRAVFVVEQSGFITTGPIYTEAGIDHQWMELSVSPTVANGSGKRHK